MPDVLECRKNVQKEECAIKRNETDPRDRQYEPDPSEQAQKRRKKAKKPNRGLRVAAVLLTIVLALEGLYCFVVFTDIPAIKSLREAYIETAMNTLSHQWLAKWFLPSYMIDEVVARQDQARKDQEGKISTWDKISASDATDKNGETVAPTEPNAQTDEERFYELFWELDRISFEDYVSAHPDVTANGWDNIYINEAGLNDDGTDIYTAMGERVLAVDAKNKILLVRVEGSGYQGVLAIAKDPSQLYNAPSAYIGSWGQQLEAIASAHDAVLGMTGSGFIDPDAQAVLDAVSRLPETDVLVNNAGICHYGLISQITQAQWDRLFAVNVGGIYHCVNAVLPAMLRRQSGCILNVSSMWGQVGASCEACYSATKGAVLALTKALAQELGPSGIRVNCVSPGVILTDMVANVAPEVLAELAQEAPLGKNGTPEDVALAMVYLAGAEFVTGQNLPVNGGFVL